MFLELVRGLVWESIARDRVFLFYFILFYFHIYAPNYSPQMTRGARVGAMVRAHASYQYGPGSISTRCHGLSLFLVLAKCFFRVILFSSS